MSESTVVAAPVIPWWKSRGVVWALSGILLAVIDAAVSLVETGNLSWRTLVIFVGGAVGAWFRKNARSIVGMAVLGQDPPELPPGPPKDPQS